MGGAKGNDEKTESTVEYFPQISAFDLPGDCDDLPFVLDGGSVLQDKFRAIRQRKHFPERTYLRGLLQWL